MRITINNWDEIDEHTTKLQIVGASEVTSTDIFLDTLLVPVISEVEAGRDNKWSWNQTLQKASRLVSRSFEKQKREYLHQIIALMVYDSASLEDITQIVLRDSDWTNLRFSNILVSFKPGTQINKLRPNPELYANLMRPLFNTWGINV